MPDSALISPTEEFIGIATDALKDVIIELQGSLIKHLRQASEDDGMTDFSILVDASDEGRIKAVSVLNDLYLRKARTISVSPNIPQILPCIPLPSNNVNGEGQIDGRAPQPDTGNYIRSIVTPWDNEVGNVPKYPSQPPLRYKHTERPEISSSSAKRKFRGIFSHIPTFGTRESHGGELGYPRGDSNDSMPPHKSAPNSNRSSAMTISSQELLDENNPWASELSRSPNETLTTSLHAQQRSQTEPSGGLQRQSTHESKLASGDVYGGFCKGAYKLQVGLRDGLKLRNQSGSFQGEGYYWACGSSKCAFEGRACKKDKEWAFDDAIRESHGVRYRWTFLAKSHVALSKVKHGIYDYRCVFCVSQSHESLVFRNAKALMEHVSQHRGQHLDEEILRKANCINMRDAADEEDFDINLTPVDAKAEPGQAVDWMSTDGVSSAWSTSEETMSDTNHWRDLTRESIGPGRG